MNTERSPSTAESTPLPNDLSVCHAMIRELLDTLKKTRHDYEGVQQRLDLRIRPVKTRLGTAAVCDVLLEA